MAGWPTGCGEKEKTKKISGSTSEIEYLRKKAGLEKG